MILRDYQQSAVNAIFNYWERGIGRNGLVVAPTGSGKSVIIAEFCKRICEEYRDAKIACVTDSKELVEQNEKELRKHYPEASTGVYSAGVGRRQTQAQITFMGIQSVYTRAFEFGKIDIICIDEAHMISRNSESMYGKFISDIKISNPNVVVIGFTATPFRLDSGLLHEGEGALFDGIAYCCDMKSLIEQKYLAPIVSKGGIKKIDLSKVHIRAGEYASNELAHAASDPELVRLAVNEIVECGHDRKSWLIFASGVDHAEMVAKSIRSHDISCEVITGDTPKEKRNSSIKRFKNGSLQSIVNIGVLTKGFNAPSCDLIALLFSTLSCGKYVQVVGRGMRMCEGKENCLLLDYGGNILRHGMIDDVDPIKKKDVFNVAKRPEPTKECPHCHAIMHARTAVCPACGYVFPVSASHGTEAYSGAVLTSQQQPFFVNVKDVWYSRHKKSGKPDILKIAMYDALDKEYPIWCCLGHTGYAQEKAFAVVKTFGGKATNVDDALKESYYWRKPIRIKVKPNGKFVEVLGIEFSNVPVTIQKEI